jgi:hypothetical protein
LESERWVEGTGRVPEIAPEAGKQGRETDLGKGGPGQEVAAVELFWWENTQTGSLRGDGESIAGHQATKQRKVEY